MEKTLILSTDLKLIAMRSREQAGPSV